jgi:hypothetical protein
MPARHHGLRAARAPVNEIDSLWVLGLRRHGLAQTAAVPMF